MVHNKNLYLALVFSFAFFGKAYAQESIVSEVNWNSLEFQGDYLIKKIIVAIPSNGDAPWEKGVLNADGFSVEGIEIRDGKRLRYLESRIVQVLKIATNEDVVKTGGYSQIGSLSVITTNGENFEIGISDAGFTLGTESTSSDTIFYSWALAKLIDEAVKSQLKIGLKKKSFDVLSGLNKIKSEQLQFEELAARENGDE